MQKVKKFFSNLYKFIIYEIFMLIYGKINIIIKPNSTEGVISENIKLDNIEYTLNYRQKSRLYTDRVHDTAIIKNSAIIDGPSFQYRENKNADCKLNSVFIKGTPRLKKIKNNKVFSLLTGGGGNSNYWHWLFDVLPRLEILQKSSKKNLDIDYYLFPSLDKKFQIETLDILNILKKSRLSSKKNRHIFSNQIIVASHPYNLLNDPLSDSLNLPKWIFNFLRKNFLKNSQDNKVYPKKIYINRKDSSTHRFIINENEISDHLTKKGFANLTLSDFSFSEQVNLFYNAEYIAGLHGAGFANIVFCKPNTKILEFRSLTAGDAIKNLALQHQLNYKDLKSKNETIDYASGSINAQFGGIKVDINSLNSILNV